MQRQCCLSLEATPSLQAICDTEIGATMGGAHHGFVQDFLIDEGQSGHSTTDLKSTFESEQTIRWTTLYGRWTWWDLDKSTAAMRSLRLTVHQML